MEERERQVEAFEEQLAFVLNRIDFVGIGEFKRQSRSVRRKQWLQVSVDERIGYTGVGSDVHAGGSRRSLDLTICLTVS